ncbi:membrane hypothetical protein [uncultured Desulfobacterium sp.]|uniref:VTT domain-containing protein n=1 Tax=uncultured Desulfobacterium sp. TaxID=201089 RepID=A0A445MU13_9BACT|nr:membrane hypothetical protein [uncultured Desulfobacterium sp.]
MKLTLKVLATALILALIFAAGFKIWAEQFELLFNQEACVRWFAEIRPHAWAVGIALLLGDILLPVPATGVMAALGSVYGFLPGAFIGLAGSAGAGVTGYAVARYLGKRATRFLASEDEVERFRAFFDKWGGAAIIISRAMPILPEVVSILAGLAGMNFIRFIAALLLGTLPTSLLFSYVGYATRSEPWYGMIAAVVAPLVIWPFFVKMISARKSTADPICRDGLRGQGFDGSSDQVNNGKHPITPRSLEP